MLLLLLRGTKGHHGRHAPQTTTNVLHPDDTVVRAGGGHHLLAALGRQRFQTTGPTVGLEGTQRRGAHIAPLGITPQAQAAKAVTAEELGFGDQLAAVVALGESECLVGQGESCFAHGTASAVVVGVLREEKSQGDVAGTSG